MIEQILEWADAHRKITDKWPTVQSGPVVGVPGENWKNIDAALRTGNRGLPAGSSLAKILDQYRRLPNREE